MDQQSAPLDRRAYIQARAQQHHYRRSIRWTDLQILHVLGQLSTRAPSPEVATMYQQAATLVRSHKLSPEIMGLVEGELAQLCQIPDCCHSGTYRVGPEKRCSNHREMKWWPQEYRLKFTQAELDRARFHVPRKDRGARVIHSRRR